VVNLSSSGASTANLTPGPTVYIFTTAAVAVNKD